MTITTNTIKSLGSVKVNNPTPVKSSTPTTVKSTVSANPKAAKQIAGGSNVSTQQAAAGIAPTDPIISKVERRAIPNQNIVLFETSSSNFDGASLKGFHQLGNIKGENGKSLTMAVIDTRFDSLNSIQQSGAKVVFSGPNYEYVGEAREGGPGKGKGKKKKTGGINKVQVTPNDPDALRQYHHFLMRNDVAWANGRGKGVVVAVFDDGHDLDHEDLMGQMWINTKEVPGDGIDNDSNGYVDDVEGLDSSLGDVDPRPDSYRNNHGTHVDGIINGRDNNGRGVAGVAPDAKVMPIRWYGGGSWTSAVIAESLMYAANNGAHVANISYNTNHWPGDKVIAKALEYAYDSGMVIVGSAGNGRQKNPPRQSMNDMVFVASTTDKDTRSSFSNSGTGVDVAAPGSDVLSTVPTDFGYDEEGNALTGSSSSYRAMSGTSMAAPNFAATVASMMGAHPEWSRAQVIDQLYGHAKDIDGKNPGYEGLLGAGRVNLGKALRKKGNPAPKFDFQVKGKTSKGFKVVVDIANNGVFEDETINNMEAFTLIRKRDAKGQRVRDKMAALPTESYKLGTNQLEFNLGRLKPGTYELRANRRAIVDPFGQKLEGDYKVEFKVEKPETSEG